jgi:hypothetical protein
VFFSPFLLVCVALGTGVLPLSFGREGMLESDFGRLDLYSIRVLGLWFACALLLSALFSRTMRYCRRFPWHLGFLLFATVAMAWAPSLAYGARMVAKLTSPFLFLLLILVAVSSWRQLRCLQYVMYFSGLMALMISVGAVVAGYVTVTSQIGLGIPGLGPSVTSAHLATLAMLTLAAARTSATPFRYLILTACFGAGVIAGSTRITIAGMFLGWAVILWMSGRGAMRWFLPLGGVVAIPALFLMNETFQRRMFKSQEGLSLDLLLKDPASAVDQIHGSGRFEQWAYVMKTFFTPSPVFGSGSGATQHYFYTHQVGLNVIHSEYVRLLAEFGLIGAGLFVLAVLAYVVRLKANYRFLATKEGQTYALAGIGSLVVYVVYMATDNAIDYVTSCGIVVFALIAMCEKARELDNRSLPVHIDDRMVGEDIALDPLAAAAAAGGRRFPLLIPK